MNYFTKYKKDSTKVDILKIKLPSSKSEANRMLIIQALCEDKNFTINNLSSARDTITLHNLLKNRAQLKSFDVLDAGTAMRFLTAYLAISTKKEVSITGTDRMQKRPIGTLVEALRTIGAKIDYQNEIGYPPLTFKPLVNQISDEITIKGNISSQYISALMMVAPQLPKGLSIKIEAPIYSQPYIDMTIGLMEEAGIQVSREENTYIIQPQSYQAKTIAVEADWSGASYWFSFVALSARGTSLFLEGLREESSQGDQAIVRLMNNLGVTTSFEPSGVKITKIAVDLPSSIDIDFKEFPDLAQTMVACCAALKVDLHLTGLESLRIKETDRINALHQELNQFGCSLTEVSEGNWKLASQGFQIPQKATINTYEDHRMAMSFMPLAIKGDLLIKNIEVVKKSYPSFWSDAQSVGIELMEQ